MGFFHELHHQKTHQYTMVLDSGYVYIFLFLGITSTCSELIQMSRLLNLFEEKNWHIDNFIIPKLSLCTIYDFYPLFIYS